MTPRDPGAVADAMIRAHRRGGGAIRMLLADVSMRDLPSVVEHLAARANQTPQRTAAVTAAQWSEGDRRAAHAAYARGVRDQWTVEGERAYQRLRKRSVRALGGGESAVDAA